MTFKKDVIIKTIFIIVLFLFCLSFLLRKNILNLIQRDNFKGCSSIMPSSSEKSIISCNENENKTQIMWVELYKCNEDQQKMYALNPETGCYFDTVSVFLKDNKNGKVNKIIESNDNFEFIYWFGDNIGFHELIEAGEGTSYLRVYNTITGLWQDGPGVSSKYFDDFAVYVDDSGQSPSSCAPSPNDGKIVLMNLKTGASKTLLEESRTMYDIKKVINSNTPLLFFTSVSVKGDIKGCVEGINGSAIERTLDIKI